MYQGLLPGKAPAFKLFILHHVLLSAYLHKYIDIFYFYMVIIILCNGPSENHLGMGSSLFNIHISNQPLSRNLGPVGCVYVFQVIVILIFQV